MISSGDQQDGRLFTSVPRVFSYSPDATYIVSISPILLSWNLQSRLPMDMPLGSVAKDLISITVSPDTTQIAMASSKGTVYLLNAATRLPACPPITTPIDGFTSLTFSPDGSRLILANMDGRTCVMNVADGKPISHTSLNDVSERKDMSFNIKQGWKDSESDETLLRWFPSDDPNVGLWAYVDGKVIRSNGAGGTSVTIIDLVNALKKQGTPI